MHTVALISLLLCALITFYVISYNSYGRFADRYSLIATIYRPARTIDKKITSKKLRKKLAGTWENESKHSVVIDFNGHQILVSDASLDSLLISGHYSLVGRDSVSVTDDKVIYLLEMNDGNLYLHANDVHSGKEIAPVKEFKKLAK